MRLKPYPEILTERRFNDAAKKMIEEMKDRAEMEKYFGRKMPKSVWDAGFMLIEWEMVKKRRREHPQEEEEDLPGWYKGS